MTNQPLYIEADWSMRNKVGQQICGDSVVARKVQDQQRQIVVMSDGLGSGVKANILSTMTATMAARFVQANMVSMSSLSVMMDALPVCKVRNISYATYTIVDTSLNGETRVIEMGNPSTLHIRDGKVMDLAYSRISVSKREDRDISIADIHIEPGDRLVVLSDGVTMAGLGSQDHKLGLRIEGVSTYILEQLALHPQMSAGELSEQVIRKALRYEPNQVPHDDMTCVAIYYREPRKLLLLTGPPFRESSDASWAQRFNSYPGDRVVCGGTTANILARELGLEINSTLKPMGGLPPISFMNGAKLVSEGILTLTRVCNLLEQGEQDNSVASKLIDELKNHDIIDVCVGTKINEAHQDPTLPSDLDIRRNIVKRLAGILEEKFLKEVSIRYI